MKKENRKEDTKRKKERKKKRKNVISSELDLIVLPDDSSKFQI